MDTPDDQAPHPENSPAVEPPPLDAPPAVEPPHPEGESPEP